MVAAGGAAVLVLEAGSGTTTAVLVTTGACVVVEAADCANCPPLLPELDVTVPVRAATASELQELGPDDQPVSLFAISEA